MKHLAVLLRLSKREVVDDLVRAGHDVLLGSLSKMQRRTALGCPTCLERAHLHVMRSKNGVDSVHPLLGDEMRALRTLARQQEQGATPQGHVFVSERGAPMQPRNFRTTGWTRAPSSTTWGIRTSSTPRATLSWRQTGSRDFGRSKRCRPSRVTPSRTAGNECELI